MMKIFVKRNRRVLIFGTVVILFLVGVGLVQWFWISISLLKIQRLFKVEDNKKDTTKENESTVKTEKLLKPVGDDVKIVKNFMMLN